ncbi:hypothetical protein GCM10010232_38190 [Streptomyces amakusaensis]
MTENPAESRHDACHHDGALACGSVGGEAPSAARVAKRLTSSGSPDSALRLTAVGSRLSPGTGQ